MLTSAIRGDEILRHRFARARQIGPVTAMGPLAVDASAAGMPGLLLAGDAAGFVDPITGDGMRFAFRGAELAARAAVRALAQGDVCAHERLACWRANEFGTKWRFNRALRVLVGSDLGVRTSSVLAPLVPIVLRKLINFAGDV